MINRTCTIFGNYELVYGGEDIENWDNYPEGGLKLNASGPAIWIALGSVMLNV